MKLSLSLVDLFLPLPRIKQEKTTRVTFDSVRIAEILTRQGFEVETIEAVGAGLETVVVGHILTCEKHPQADKLNVCQVDVGAGQPLQIVCGAPNARAGLFVAVALVGSALPGGIQIGVSDIRGVKSSGMLCSRAELGLSALAGASGVADDGIWELTNAARQEALWPLSSHNGGGGRGGIDCVESDLKTFLGAPVLAAMRMDDIILETCVTPNRADALCHLGIARELAAGFAFADTAVPLRNSLLRHKSCTAERLRESLNGASATESSENSDGVLKIGAESFSAVTLQGVPAFFLGMEVAQVPQSALWAKIALERIGQNSINAVVDATNLVLQLFGHPSHAFDVEKLAKNKENQRSLTLRGAEEGESFAGLDGKLRSLIAADSVVADASAPQALLGVLGGELSKVDGNTRLLALEFANPFPVTVRRSSLRHGRRTDSSFLFEKGIDTATRPEAAAELVGFISALVGAQTHFSGLIAARDAGGKICSNSQETRLLPVAIPYKRDSFIRLVGSPLSAILGEGETHFSRQLNVLRLLGFTVVEHGESAVASPPSWRLGDCNGVADLVEEVVRFVGIDKVPEIPLYAPNVVEADDPHLGIVYKAERALVGAGYFETAGFHFMRADDWQRMGFSAPEALGTPLVILNPISTTDSLLQTTQIPDLLRKVQHNLRFGTLRGMLSASTRTFQNHAENGDVVLPNNFAALYGRESQVNETNLCEYAPGLSYPYGGAAGTKGRPAETPRLAGVVFGEREPKSWWNAAPLMWQLADILSHVQSVVKATLPAATLMTKALSENHPFFPALHPGRCAQLFLKGASGQEFLLGWAGSLHPATARQFDIDVPCFAFELNMRSLVLAEAATAEFPQAVSSGVTLGAGRLMPVVRDFSFGVPETTAAATIETALLLSLNQALEVGSLRGQKPQVRIFDVYRGNGVAVGQKNVALSVMLQAVERTFTEAEIRSFSEVIAHTITGTLRGELRG